MRLQEILKENHRADLYHGTSLDNAEKIVASNEMKANTPIHNPSIASSQGNKTVSLSRDIKTAAKLADSDYGSIGVVLVLDGSKLQQNMGKKVKPYDDKSTQWYRDQLARYGQAHTLDANRSPRTQGGGNEKEEAVFGDIKDVNSYIKKIIIFYDPESGGDNKEKIKQRLLKSPLLNNPKVEFANLDAEYARTPRQMQSRLTKNGPVA